MSALELNFNLFFWHFMQTFRFDKDIEMIYWLYHRMPTVILASFLLQATVLFIFHPLLRLWVNTRVQTKSRCKMPFFNFKYLKLIFTCFLVVVDVIFYNGLILYLSSLFYYVNEFIIVQKLGPLPAIALSTEQV